MKSTWNRKNREMPAQNRRDGGNDLATIFQIRERDVLSLTGSGGKTTLLFHLAAELRKRGSVLVTTSTKIALPDSGFDFLYTSLAAYKEAAKEKRVVCCAGTGAFGRQAQRAGSLWGPSVTCLGEKVPGIAKLTTVGETALRSICSDFDYCLIEADGSRRLPLKFWKAHEPVIYDFSTQVIGILPIKVYGKMPSADFIYNFEGYRSYIGSNRIDASSIARLLTYPDGLFKGFFGPRMVFINQVETEEDFQHLEEIRCAFCNKVKLTYGSLKEGKFYAD